MKNKKNTPRSAGSDAVDNKENMIDASTSTHRDFDGPKAPIRMTPSGVEARQRERSSKQVATIVMYRENDTEITREMTDVSIVSKNGASLILSRRWPIGRLLSLVMQMPDELRVYDHGADVYPVMAIVQNCIESDLDGTPVFPTGVAFIGKIQPESFKADPTQCYYITGLDETGLWRIKESENAFHARKHARFWRRVPVTIAVRDEATRTSHKAELFTRDISRGGLAVWGPLDVAVGDRVKISSKDHDFYSMAVVKGRSEGRREGDPPLIHLQFDGYEFPVTKFDVPNSMPKEDSPEIKRKAPVPIIEAKEPEEHGQTDASSGDHAEDEFVKF